MPKFLLTYRDLAEPASRPSPEEMQAFLALWGEWFGKFGDAIVDGGDGLKPGGRVLKAGGVVSDGPHPEAKEVLTGYSIIRADDIEGALAIARDCPIARTGGSIEIREFAGYS